MWKRTVDGRTLTFRLAGINNQNFLMRDEESGSWWQQISGKAISGPYRGRQLDLVRSDELTSALWRKENPGGTVLKPVERFVAKYETKDWEKQMRKTPTVVDTRGSGLESRELIFGVEENGAARAFILSRVLEEKLVQDWIGGSPVIVVVGSDGKSVRAFEAVLHGAPADFYWSTGAILRDSATGSTWDFRGCAVSGPVSGECLRPLPGLRDYWFDWRLYHPRTSIWGLRR